MNYNQIKTEKEINKIKEQDDKCNCNNLLCEHNYPILYFSDCIIL